MSGIGSRPIAGADCGHSRLYGAASSLEFIEFQLPPGRRRGEENLNHRHLAWRIRFLQAGSGGARMP